MPLQYNLYQLDLPFIKADKLQKSKIQSFKLPSIDLLKISKREKRNSDNENVDNFDFIKVIAIARITMPKTYVRLSAGR